MINLPIIELDMIRKDKAYQVTYPAFTGEDNVYVIRLKPIDYDWTDKVATIVWSARGSTTGYESAQITPVDGVVSMTVTSAWVSAGVNRLQLNIYDTDGVSHEQSPIVEWYVSRSLPATDPAPERVDIIADLIAQTATAVDSLESVETTCTEAAAAAAQSAEDASQAAIDGLDATLSTMDATATTLPPSTPATATLDKSGEVWEMRFGIPQGETGPQGEQGPQGIPGADGLTISVNEVEQVNGNVTLALDDIPDGATRSISALAADIDALSIKRYGVRFGGSANTGVTVIRLYDAVGMVANPSTDAEIAVNNFDDIYPWSGMRPCCGDYDANGNMVVNAWYGDPTFKRDGTNGNVWVYVPEFWWSWTTTADVEDIIVSPSEISGYVHSPARYIAAYKMSKTAGDLAASVSGVFSEYGSLITLMARARTLGSRYCVGQIAEWVELGILFAVEYATRNCQAIMTGYVKGVYGAACKATTEGTDQFISTSTLCSGFLVGQVVGVGTADGDLSIASNATIESITNNAGTYTINLDTSGATIPIDSVLWNLPYKTGVTDMVLGPSGSPVSNVDNKHVCRYRYIEDPWGSAYEDVCDVACVRTGDGTAESPYVYTPWYLPDASKWTNGDVTADYVQLDYVLPVADGYITSLGVDEDYPVVRLPSAASAGYTTYWSDYYYYPRSALTSVRRGGHLNLGAYAGLFCWYCHAHASYSHWSYRARLSCKTG